MQGHPRNGRDTYLVTSFEINKNRLSCMDEGFDVETNQKVWGSNHGLLKFDRINEPENNY